MANKDFKFDTDTFDYFHDNYVRHPSRSANDAAHPYNGLGRKVLKKNVDDDDQNVLTPAMVSQANTVYIIMYDYILLEDVTLPAGCVILFDGGSISGGGFDIYGNGTQIISLNGSARIFGASTTLKGTWKGSALELHWFTKAADCQGSAEATGLAIHVTGSVTIDEPMAMFPGMTVCGDGIGKSTISLSGGYSGTKAVFTGQTSVAASGITLRDFSTSGVDYLMYRNFTGSHTSTLTRSEFSNIAIDGCLIYSNDKTVSDIVVRGIQCSPANGNALPFIYLNGEASVNVVMEGCRLVSTNTAQNGYFTYILESHVTGDNGQWDIRDSVFDGITVTSGILFLFDCVNNKPMGCELNGVFFTNNTIRNARGVDVNNDRDDSVLPTAILCNKWTMKYLSVCNNTFVGMRSGSGTIEEAFSVFDGNWQSQGGVFRDIRNCVAFMNVGMGKIITYNYGMHLSDEECFFGQDGKKILGNRLVSMWQGELDSFVNAYTGYNHGDNQILVYDWRNKILNVKNPIGIFGKIRCASDLYPLKGTTAERPAVGEGDEGTFTYFDTDLGKPIWHNGTEWVDATGTPV